MIKTPHTEMSEECYAELLKDYSNMQNIPNDLNHKRHLLRSLGLSEKEVEEICQIQSDWAREVAEMFVKAEREQTEREIRQHNRLAKKMWKDAGVDREPAKLIDIESVDEWPASQSQF